MGFNGSYFTEMLAIFLRHFLAFFEYVKNHLSLLCEFFKKNYLNWEKNFQSCSTGAQNFEALKGGKSCLKLFQNHLKSKFSRKLLSTCCVWTSVFGVVYLFTITYNLIHVSYVMFLRRICNYSRDLHAIFRWTIFSSDALIFFVLKNGMG